MGIYLDNLASTPVDPRVAEHQAAKSLELPGNPNSGDHASGRAARSAIEVARSEVAAFLGREANEVEFTPGASSALWVALEDLIARAGTKTPKVVATAVEHPALLHHLVEADRQRRIQLTLSPVDDLGQPDVEAMRRLCRNGVDLVCAMAANNELGTISPLVSILELAQEHGARTLVDASQLAGRGQIRDRLADADHVVASGAKMYGPRRVGVVAGALTRRTLDGARTLFGTPDAAAASAMAFACHLRQEEMTEDEARIGEMRDQLQAALLSAVPGMVLNGAVDARLSGALHVSAPDVAGDEVVARLWGKVDVSTGAACQSGVPGPSHVLSAMRVQDWVAEGAVRICVGKFNKPSEIARAAELIAEAMTARPAIARKYA